MNRLTRGFGALVATIAVVGILVVVELISMEYHYTWDLTANRRHSLSEQSLRALERLTQEVSLLAFYIEGTPGRRDIEDLLKQYRDASERIDYELIDPQREVGKARQYEVTADERVVVLSGEKRETVTFADEEKLTNAILKVTREGGQKVYFTAGHGERQIDDATERGLARLRSTLQDAGYTVASLNLAGAAGVPEDADAVVVAGPRADLLEPEAERLAEYLKRGGRVLVMADPPRQPMPRLVGLLKPYGLDLRDAILIEPNLRLALPDPLVAIVDQFGSHPITNGLDSGNLAAFMPIARPVIPADQPPEGVELTWLARSSTTSWATPRETLRPGATLAFDSKRDIKGPVTVAAAATFTVTAPAGKEGGAAAGSEGAKPATAAGGSPAAGSGSDDGAAREAATADDAGTADEAGTADQAATAGEAAKPPEEKGRLVVIGDSDFASNQWFESSANRELAISSLSWLVSEEPVLSISERERISAPLFLTSGQTLAVLALAFVVLPLGAAAAGFGVWFARRRRHG